MGRGPSPFRRRRSSVPSSIMVRSAEKSESNTYRKPRRFRAVTRRPVLTVPGSSPRASARVTRTDGATWTTRVLPTVICW